VRERVHVHKYLSGAGVLKRLVVAAIDGKAEVKLSGFGKGCLLAFNEKRNQLFIVGGDQSVDLAAFGIDPAGAHELETLGRVTKIGYFTSKEHLGDEGGDGALPARFPHDERERPARNGESGAVSGPDLSGAR
jgi:hypothetical protein